MKWNKASMNRHAGIAASPAGRPRAFTLIELLTVIFVIGLLIAILVPALSGARNQAKATQTKALIRVIGVGLESFRGENESEFGRTNGYPPSFAHPEIQDSQGNPVFREQDAIEGKFPYIQGFPHVYGAHFLPAMLMGRDLNGFVREADVPERLSSKPWDWYKEDPQTKALLPRTQRYLESDQIRLAKTNELRGAPRDKSRDFPDWKSATDPEDMSNLPVIIDSFDTPVLYYAANRTGSDRNMLEDKRVLNSATAYNGKPPRYFHQDNVGFTGFAEDVSGKAQGGWDFGNREPHPIGVSGHDADAISIDEDERFRDSFAQYIHDRALHGAQTSRTVNSPLRPVNADSHILISAGRDGLYGTLDDISNIPESNRSTNDD